MKKLTTFLKSPAFMVGLFILLSVVAIAGVLYGVLTHDEPGLSDESKSWGHMPLAVACRGYVPAEDDACSTAEYITSIVNRRLGFDALSWTGEREGGDIEIIMRAPVEVGVDEPGGFFGLRGTGDRYEHCGFRTMNSSGGASDLEQLVVYHELGHCLGLAHDDYEQSIMFGTQVPTPSGQIPPWISDHDRRVLRERYAP